MLTSKDVEDAARLLCAEFGVRRLPKIHWSMRSRNGRYRDGGALPTITVGPHAWRGVEACMLHEIAHHVDREGNREDGNLRPRRRWHDERFYLVLRHVVTAWYGDIESYPWETEYRSIARAAGRPRGKRS